MIRYALACAEGHDFESWFPSAASYDAQAARGLVACPVCGTANVDKRIMAPALGRGGTPRLGDVTIEASGSQTSGPTPPAVVPPQAMALMSERDQAIRAMLRAVREHVTRTSDYVGTGFAEEARRMHHGEIDHRSIYGEANAAEARALLDEGIEVHPLPIMPDDRN